MTAGSRLARSLGALLTACVATSCFSYSQAVTKPTRTGLGAATLAEIAAGVGAAAIDQAQCDGCSGLTGEGTRGWGGSLLIGFGAVITTDMIVALVLDAIESR